MFRNSVVFNEQCDNKVIETVNTWIFLVFGNKIFLVFQQDILEIFTVFIEILEDFSMFCEIVTLHS